MNNLINIVLFLIKSGADFNLEDKNGKDFIDYLTKDKANYICDKFKDKCEKHLLKKSANKYKL